MICSSEIHLLVSICHHLKNKAVVDCGFSYWVLAESQRIVSTVIFSSEGRVCVARSSYFSSTPDRKEVRGCRYRMGVITDYVSPQSGSVFRLERKLFRSTGVQQQHIFTHNFSGHIDYILVQDIQMRSKTYKTFFPLTALHHQ